MVLICNSCCKRFLILVFHNFFLGSKVNNSQLLRNSCWFMFHSEKYIHVFLSFILSHTDESLISWERVKGLVFLDTETFSHMKIFYTLFFVSSKNWIMHVIIYFIRVLTVHCHPRITRIWSSAMPVFLSFFSYHILRRNDVMSILVLFFHMNKLNMWFLYTYLSLFHSDC